MERNRLHGAMTVFTVLLCLVALPNLASAQQIGGAVTDTTGGVLPGVTVEARSPAIIEQVRTVVSDGAGQYLIIALESGTYTVTYTLPGFGTFVREGIVLTSGFTANVDVQLSVGDIQESVTVSGASPVVDIQNVAQRAIMDRDVIDSIPTGKSIGNYGLLIPGMSSANSYGSSFSQDAGGLALQSLQTLAIHGGHEEDQVISINGLEVGDAFLQGASVGYFPDTSFEEMAFSYSGNSAQLESGGREYQHDSSRRRQRLHRQCVHDVQLLGPAGKQPRSGPDRPRVAERPRARGSLDDRPFVRGPDRPGPRLVFPDQLVAKTSSC